MKAVLAVLKDFAAFFNPQTRVGLIRLIILIAALTAAYFLLSGTSQPDDSTEVLKTVRTASISSFDGESSVFVTGTVEAVDQATLKAESSGQVTAVNVKLGQTVTAGSVLATLENASERAALLQAEGVYESALAGAAQSNVSVSEAQNALDISKNSALSSVRSALNVAEDTVFNSFDQFFANPNSQTPGLRLTGTSYTATLNTDRVALQTTMSTWSNTVTSLQVDDDLFTAINVAEKNITELSLIADKFIALFNNYDGNTYSDSEIDTFSSDFNTLKTTLNSTLSSLSAAHTSLKNSNDTLERVRISSTEGDVSSANAQVKQALGALRSAQANLAKTIISTPIAGEVNTLNIKVGDYVNNSELVATVANNQALEITAYIGEEDRNDLEIGQTLFIEDSIEGVVTAISPAVDPLTRKVEVIIATESNELANGDTVKITIAKDTKQTSETSNYVVPITAIKFSDTAGSIYTVDNNTIIAHPVEIGRIVGSSVEIISGVDSSMNIVVDARGLTPGEEVEAVSSN